MAERWWDTRENLKPCMILTRYDYNLSRVMQILPVNALSMWVAAAGILTEGLAKLGADAWALISVKN